jgi:SH3 domain-containing YSC84-like protein 1
MELSEEGVRGMKKAVVFFAALAFSLGLSACADMRQSPVTEAQNLVNNARETVERFKGIPDLVHFAKYIPGARAVVVLPKVIKGGFILGAEGGSGVLVSRNITGDWGYPAFYTLGAGSFGFQAGLQETEIILVIRTAKALNAIIANQGMIGADTGVTVGIIGIGMEASTTSNVGADVLAFTNAKLGLYGGISLDGSVLAKRNDLNEAYYEPGATPQAIVLQHRFSNPAANALLEALDAK